MPPCHRACAPKIQFAPPSSRCRLMTLPVARTLEVLAASLGGVPSMAALCLALDLWVRAWEP